MLRPNHFDRPFEDLPRTISVMAINGAALLPQARLPLQVSDAKEINLILDAMAQGRMCGIIQPKDKTELAPTYDVGCLGRIVSYQETLDNKLSFTLLGICRFKVVGELAPVKGYRRFTVSYEPFRTDMLSRGDFLIDRGSLWPLLATYAKLNEVELDLRSLEMLSDAALIIQLVMLCPFATNEKQALLEIPTPLERAKLLHSLLSMAVNSPGFVGNNRKYFQ